MRPPADITAKLRRLIKLAKKHEHLQNDLMKIEGEFAAILDEVSLPHFQTAVRPHRSNQVIGKLPALAAQTSEYSSVLRPQPKKKRAELKNPLLATLKEAGSTGLSVKELAVKLGTTRMRVNAWFHATGKKTPGVSRIQPEHWAYVEPESM